MMRGEDDLRFLRDDLVTDWYVARRDSSAWRAQIVATCVGAGIVRASVVLPALLVVEIAQVFTAFALFRAVVRSCGARLALSYIRKRRKSLCRSTLVRIFLPCLRALAE